MECAALRTSKGHSKTKEQADEELFGPSKVTDLVTIQKNTAEVKNVAFTRSV